MTACRRRKEEKEGRKGRRGRKKEFDAS